MTNGFQLTVNGLQLMTNEFQLTVNRLQKQQMKSVMYIHSHFRRTG